ncbi:MAG: prepilin peptidase [Oscillospiraceae bacterium]|nr:prepilin peptidase [Oscillospiraceae bacterium]
MDSNKRSIAYYCAGFVIVMCLWLIVYANNYSALLFLRFVLLIIFGYTAMVFDIRIRKIPNLLVLLMFIAWLLLLFPVMFYDIGFGLTMLTDSLLGMLTGGGLFFLVYVISRRGLGGGDVKFMAAAGLYLGFSETVPVIFYGTLLAAVTGIVLILLKKIKRKDTMPLAPFLFVGIMITAFSG